MFRPTVCVLFGMTLLPLIAWGQPTPPSVASPPGVPYRYQDSVHVTASIGATTAADTPSTVRSIDQMEIEDRQATHVFDLLATLPGIDAVSLGSPGQQTSLFVRGAESDQALVLWNGLPLNDPYFGGFNWAFLPTEGVERVEVVTGPYSALYGSAAAGGVIQLITGRDSRTSRLGFEAGDHQHRRVSTSLHRTVSKVDFDLHGHWSQGDGNYPNDFYDSVEVASRTSVDVTSRFRLGLRSRINDSSTGVPFDGLRASLERRIDWRESEVALPVALTLDRWDLEGYLARTDYDNHFSDPQDPFGFIDGRTDSVASRLRSTATYRPGSQYWIAVGVEFERLEVTDRSSFGLNLEAARQQTKALFSQVHGISGPLVVDLGIRYDDNDVFGSQTSPRLGLVWALTESLRLRGSYGEGFRAPSLGELFFPFSGNPDLQPEHSEGAEFGVVWQPGAWSFDLVGFETRYSNLIDYDFAAGGNVNLGRARNRGIEAEVRYRSAGWEMRAQWTHLDAKSLRTGEALKRRPDNSASASLTVRPGRWSLNLTSRYTGVRPDVDPVTFATATSPSYLRHDLAARCQVGTRWAPYLRLVNAADQSYQEALGFPAPGRTLTGGVTLSF